MMGRMSASYDVRPVGVVRSTLRDLGDAPRQGDEGAPSARIQVVPEARAALVGLSPGDRVLVLTWLHLGDRTVLRTVPRNDPDRAPTGVFATRSPDRPNPVGLHPCTIIGVDAEGIVVDGIEALDGTPVIDVKCELPPVPQR